MVSLPGCGIPVKIRDSPKFFPYFRHCIGALDGTYIPAIFPATSSGKYRNRKGFCSQNVLDVCNFELEFLYVLPGWKGSAHDGRVLKDAVHKGFVIPEGKYYLGDAGYAMNHYTMTPFRGTRYHLKEFASGNQKPQNKEELFNLRHAQLRNAIERAYGLIKNKFPILRRMPSYPYETQVDLVLGAFAIHNFIRQQKDKLADTGMPPTDDYNNDDHPITPLARDEKAASRVREEIASDMWRDYTMLVAERHGEVVQK